LKKWPWETVRLVTYSSPVVGDKAFTNSFDKTIHSRRIWLAGDPITIEALTKHFHVGEAFRIEATSVTKLHDPFSRHEPFEVRRNLLLSLKAADVDTSRVPAASGNEDENEPMKYFLYCADALLHLEKLQTARAHKARLPIVPNVPHFPLSELFPDFIKHFKLYLDIFAEWEEDLSPIKAKGVKLRNIKYHLEKLETGPASLQDLESYVKDADTIQSDQKAFSNFIGLCFFLANLSKGFGCRENLSDRIGENAKYADLLKTKI
jgi:hypothetical protein